MDIQWLPALSMNVRSAVFSNEVPMKGSSVTLFKQNEFEMIVYTMIIELWETAKCKNRNCFDFMII